MNEYDIIWFRLGHRITADMLALRQRCRMIVCPVTGLDHIDIEACQRAGVVVVSLKGEVEFLRTVRSTAEHTLALILALVRKLPAAHNAVLRGEWDRDRFQGNELHGKTLGLVGVGRLGTLVAGMAKGFGLQIIGYDPRPDFPESICERCEDLEELIARADIVSIHVAYTPATHHLFGNAQFRAMKTGSLLVNTARGGVIDNVALVEALTNGPLSGAALDVIDGEPELGSNHPLIAHARQNNRLVLTPHIGGNTFEAFEKTEAFIARKVIEQWPALAQRMPS